MRQFFQKKCINGRYNAKENVQITLNLLKIKIIVNNFE